MNHGIASMRHAAAQLDSIKNRIARHKEKAERVATHLMTTAEVALGAFGGGFLIGRFPDKTVLNQKPDLVGGAALVTACAFDLFGRQTDHVLAIGQGLLASAATRLGAAQGAKMASGPVAHAGLYAGDWGNVRAMPSPAERMAAQQAAHYAHASANR